MNIERLKSGSYRLRETKKGVKYQITLDYKPTKAEARAIMDELIEGNHDTVKLSFYKAAQKYVEIKSNVLSPSTIREYSRKIDRLSKKFVNLNVESIKSVDIQEEVNIIAGKCSAKTTKDMYGFITAVINQFVEAPRTFKVTLPMIVPKDPYVPTADELKRIIAESKGTQYEIPIRLAAFGLRRSEILAVTADDLDGNILHITKSMVQDKDKNWVIKDYGKTPRSIRSIPIEDDLADMIREQGYAFKGFPGTISNYLRRTQDKLKMPHFSLHKERHFFATTLGEMDSISLKDAMQLGGWSSSYTMDRIYKHQRISEDLKRQNEIKDKLSQKLK